MSKNKTEERQLTEEELKEYYESRKAAGIIDDPEDNMDINEKISTYPTFSTFKVFIEQILTQDNYEIVIVNTVDDLLLSEQNALKEETKQETQRFKYILGRALTECMCYGDQKNFLLLMADRLGYRAGR